MGSVFEARCFSAWLILYLVLAAAQCIAGERSRHRTAAVLKTTLMPCLAALFLAKVRAKTGGGIRAEAILFLTALLMDWIGDLLLLSSRMEMLSLGAGSFLIGHLLRFAVFIRATAFPVPMAPCLAAACLYGAVLCRLCPVFGRRLGGGRYTAGIFLYGIAIALMSLGAFVLMLCAAAGNLCGAAAYAGSVLFILSDLRLIDTFTRKEKNSGVMELYASGQLLMALGIAGIL